MRLSRRRFVLGLVSVPIALVAACGEDDPGVVIVTSTADTPASTSAAPVATSSPTAEPTPAVALDADLHVLVDKERALPEGFVPDSLEVMPFEWHAPERGGLELRANVIEATRPMVDAAAEDGVGLRIRSAYRSYSEQQWTFAYWVEVMGEAQARRESAEPGHSEHQLGTTMDFASPENGWELIESFAETTEGRWLEANAYRFGFAMSYPRDGEPITGYIFEPWHFRYIGVEAAEAWHASGLTLIEFLEELHAL